MGRHVVHGSPARCRVGRGAVAAVVSSLKRKLGGDLSAIAFLSIENEAALSTNRAPFTLQSGAVAAASGKSYDMGVDAQRAALAFEGGTFWASSVCAAAKKAAAGKLLCTSGMFSMQAVHKDYRDYVKAMPPCKARPAKTEHVLVFAARTLNRHRLNPRRYRT